MESRSLFLEKERIKTFTNWPLIDSNTCNVLKMAEAGFYSIATGADDADAVKCFLCGKELDGWQPDDDPWEEHRSHSANCVFVQLGRKQDELSLEELLSIVKQYMIDDIKRHAEYCKQKINERAEIIRRNLGLRKK